MKNTFILILSMLTSSALAQMVPLTKSAIPQVKTAQEKLKQTSQAKTNEEYVTLCTVVPAMAAMPDDVWSIVHQYANTSECITQQIFPTPISKQCFYCFQLEHPQEYQRLFASDLLPEQAILLMLFSSYQESLLKQSLRKLFGSNVIEQMATHYGVMPNAIWQALKSLSTQEQLLLTSALGSHYSDNQLLKKSAELSDQQRAMAAKNKDSHPNTMVTRDKELRKCTCPIEVPQIISLEENEQDERDYMSWGPG